MRELENDRNGERDGRVGWNRAADRQRQACKLLDMCWGDGASWDRPVDRKVHIWMINSDEKSVRGRRSSGMGKREWEKKGDRLMVGGGGKNGK